MQHSRHLKLAPHQPPIFIKTSRVRKLPFYSNPFFILRSLYLQVIFEGIRGSNWQGDIAIDELKIINCDGGGGGGGGAGAGAGVGGGGGKGCGESVINYIQEKKNEFCFILS